MTTNTQNNEVVNEATGEIVPAGEFSQRNIGQDIVSINNGTAAFYSSLTGDDFDTKMAVVSALSNAEPLSEHLKEPLKLVNVIIQEVELENEQTKRMESAPRCTLILEDGTALAATSIGIFSSLKQLLGAAGEPSTWERPVECYAVEEKARKGMGKYMTIKYGTPSKK